METQTQDVGTPITPDSTSAVTQGTAEVATANGVLTDDQIGEQLKPLAMELVAAEERITAAKKQARFHACAATTEKDAAEAARQDRDQVGLEYGRWCWALYLNHTRQGSHHGQGFRNACVHYQQDYQKARYWRDRYAIANDLKPRPTPKSKSNAATVLKFVPLSLGPLTADDEKAVIANWEKLGAENATRLVVKALSDAVNTAVTNNETSETAHETGATQEGQTSTVEEKGIEEQVPPEVSDAAAA